MHSITHRGIYTSSATVDRHVVMFVLWVFHGRIMGGHCSFVRLVAFNGYTRLYFVPNTTCDGCSTTYINIAILTVEKNVERRKLWACATNWVARGYRSTDRVALNSVADAKNAIKRASFNWHDVESFVRDTEPYRLRMEGYWIFCWQNPLRATPAASQETEQTKEKRDDYFFCC